MGDRRAWATVAVAVLAGTITPATAGTAAEQEPPPTGRPRITVTEIDPPAGHTVRMHDWSEINDRGQVLVLADAADGGGTFHAVWHRGTTEILGGHSENRPTEIDLSNRGHVVAPVDVPGCEPAPPAFRCMQLIRWWRGEVTVLPTATPVVWAVPTVNDRGDVVSLVRTTDPALPEEAVDEVVLWREGEAIGPPVDGAHRPGGINTSGLVSLNELGSLEEGFLECAVMWQIGGDVARVGPCESPFSTTVIEVTERGQALGAVWTLAGPLNSFVWEDGRMTDTGRNVPVDLNERGEVVSHTFRTYRDERALLWREGTTTDLGTLGGAWSRPAAINDRSQVVGTSQTADGERHAFLWQDGQLVDLGALAGAQTESTALDVNNRGQVIGTVDGRPVIWTIRGRTVIPGIDPAAAP